MKMLPFHEAANLFPMMAEDELNALAEDIKKHGLRQPIVFFDGHILDGRNRLKACALAGVKPKFVTIAPIFDGSPLDYVISMNLHRRHLTSEQKREIVAAVLKESPDQSNRQVAGQVKVDHKTVADVRHELESTGEIPQLERTKGKDGKKRPAARRTRKAHRPALQLFKGRREEESKTEVQTDLADQPKTQSRWEGLRYCSNTLYGLAREVRRLASCEVAYRKTADVRAFVQRLRQEADRVEREVLLD
jgi:ParB-like chromosome segregation protein Spo0J